jgi:NAD(P)-dependent dehydrogenase (short-subunit alcohol dehydrogenase family)
MKTDLEGKTAIVTGGGAGIGLATAKMLAGEGANVVVVDLDTKDVVLADDSPGKVLPVVADLSDGSSAMTAVEAAMENFGSIDVLVNNVGIAPTREGFVSVTDEEWNRVLNLNFMTAVRFSRAVIPQMIEQGRGSIVSLASDVARQPDHFFPDYGVSKAAIAHLSKVISIEFGPKGIRSNAVAPGPTRTSLWDRPGGFADYLAGEYKMDRETAVEHFAKVIRNLPMGRIGQPEDVAAVITFLSSGLARQITGSVYCVDSGSMRAI